MKYMKKKHLGYMSAIAATLLLASCTNDVSYDYEGESSYNNELVDVTFCITAEDLGLETRASSLGESENVYPNEGLGSKQVLSRGSKIDMLVYAVYMHSVDEEGNLEYKLLTQYRQGYVDTNGNPTLYFDNKPSYVDYLERPGQTIVNVKDVFNKPDGDYGAYTMKLRLMRNQQYTIAFWAQCSDIDCYDTKDLMDVKVTYTGENNDERRDAFCKAEVLSVGNNSPARTVILKRPFAQINVATTGADYKNLVEGKYVFKNMEYKYSRIKISGLSQKINVVSDEVDGENLVDATFDWAVMPAFMKLKEKDDFNAFADQSEMTEDEKKEYKNHLIKRNNEEFLYVKLVSGSKYLDYKTDWPTIKDGEFETETFKYLSMSYVLVPSAKKYEGTDGEPSGGYLDYDYVTSVLQEVRFEFAENEDGSNSNEYQSYQALTNVPVKRNWRTNILGGFGIETTPNSIFNLAAQKFIQHSNFDNSQNDIYNE